MTSAVTVKVTASAEGEEESGEDVPEELRDYVIVHELSHRRYMNHSAEFWEEVEKYCPEYRTYRKQLKDYELT